jgi:predicted nucleic acid-binding protein
MAANVLVDACFLVALLNRRDTHHDWAKATAIEYSGQPWRCCEAVISETIYLLSEGRTDSFIKMLRRGLVLPINMSDELEAVLSLMERYARVPMSFADACLVRMTEKLPDPLVLSTGSDFRIYRRHGRQVVPCVLPS